MFNLFELVSKGIHAIARARRFRVAFVVLSLLALNAQAVSAASLSAGFYFANDRVRVAKLIELKQVLQYRVAPAGERRYRETYFDSADLTLYKRGMFYRLKENFDGRGQVDVFNGRASTNGSSSGSIDSVMLPPDKVLAARQGGLNSQELRQRLPLSADREVNIVQLLAEYARHSVDLISGGKHQYRVSLLVGTFEGSSGRKLRKEFWALEIEDLQNNPTPVRRREIRRIADYLIPELKLNSNSTTLYAQGVKKSVLLWPDERRILAVNIVGGTHGDFPEQFNEPDAVAFTMDGRLVAGDTDNARVKIYRFNGSAHTIQVIGREGSAPGEFSHNVANRVGSLVIYHQVQGIAVDKNGLIYVIDQGNHRIQVFDSTGTVLPDKAIPLTYCPVESPHCPDALWRPTRKNEYTSLQGLAIDQEGGMFVSDSGISRIYRVFPGGGLDPEFNMPELDPMTKKPLLKEPESMVLYRDKLLVASEGTGDIRIFDRRSGKPDGPRYIFGAEIFSGDVEGLAVTGDYLFAVDVNNTRIAVFDLGSETPRFLMGFVSDHESADGIAVDPTGKYVAIADQGNSRIVLYNLEEIMNYLAQAQAEVQGSKLQSSTSPSQP